MKQIINLLLVVLGFIFGVSGPAMTGNTANQILVVNVQVINKTSITGTPWMAGVNALASGQEVKVPKDNSVPYSIIINGKDNVTITGKIDSPMPTGTDLYVTPASSRGATNEGMRLSTIEQDLVTGINKETEDGKSITYSFTYLFNETANAVEETRQGRPAIVTLTVYF